MVERIPQHKHCTNCGKAVPVDESYCSDNCKEQWDAVMKKRVLYYRLFFVPIGILLFLMIFGRFF